MLAALVAVVAGLLLLSARSHHLAQLPPPASSQPIVQRVKWSSGRPFAKALRRAALPVVLVDSAVATWPAKDWTPRSLRTIIADDTPELRGIYRNCANRYFGPFWDPGRPAGRHLSAPLYSAAGGDGGLTSRSSRRLNPYEQNVSMKTAAFFAALDTPLDDRDSHLYLTQELADLNPSRSLERSADLSELLRLNAKAASVNLWAGQTGVVAPCHYDGHHNMYVQLSGRKRFWIWPPTAWPLLRPFPFLHPSHAQAQVNVSTVIAAATDTPALLAERLAAAEARVVDLDPGELLYLPPLWFHQTEALTPSISLNVWTQTEAAAVADRLVALELPLPSGFSVNDGSLQAVGRVGHRRVGWFARAVRLFVRKVIQRGAEERRQWLAEESEAAEIAAQGEWGSLGSALPRLRLSDLELKESSNEHDTTASHAHSHRDLLRSHFNARFGLGVAPWSEHTWEGLADAQSAVSDACDVDESRWVLGAATMDDEAGLQQKQEVWANEATTLLLELPRAERGLWLGNLLEAWMAQGVVPATVPHADDTNSSTAPAAPYVSGDGVLHAAALFKLVSDC